MMRIEDETSTTTGNKKTSENICSLSHCPDYHGAKQDHVTEMIKSPKPNSEICGETTLNGNELNTFNIPQCNGKTYSVISGEEFSTLGNLTQQRQLQSGENHIIVKFMEEALREIVP
ncbi:uncharacterized protein LOC143235319 isoform X2 [Tachypleus tridentatus]|uniref:uncharacterized protein LOC143235319 isoform X2 n=1 Tax=Tachypleus tridentatus TaxID=6853 RepID=UPI003FD4299E